MRLVYLTFVLAVLLVGHAAAAVVISPHNREYSYHNTLHEILKDGSYAELQDLRKETGVEWLPWIDSLRDFSDEQELYEEIQEALERRQEEYEDHLKELERYREKRGTSSYSVHTFPRGYEPRNYPAPLSTRFVDQDNHEPPRVRSAATWDGRPLAGHYSLRHLYREARQT